MNNVLRFLILPKEISDFERRYLARVNRVALVFFAMHVPVFVLIAWANDTRPLLAALLSSAVLVGPAIAQRTLTNPRAISVVYGISAMFMGGLLVHFGQGPIQIEMHFYFFALLAMCAVFGNPLVIIAATVTVALHHLVVYLVLPRSVFNYDAAWWVVAVHAAFVVLEAVAACFISRSFFDNVIGLEKIVQTRTRELRLLLDNMQQGFLTIDRAAVLAPECSAAIVTAFGSFEPTTSWFDYLSKVSPEFAERTRVAWEEVAAGFMPTELTIEQLPHRLIVGSTVYRVDYRPIGVEPHERFLVIVTDVTSDVEREYAELERHEAMAVFERVLEDRSGFETFFEEGSNIVATLSDSSCRDLALIKRMLHTLKGNAALFGLSSTAKMCHELEDYIVEEGCAPSLAAYKPLNERWSRLASDVEKLLCKGVRTIQIDDAQYRALESAVRTGESRPALLDRVQSFKLEATKKQLSHFAEQARRIAQRLDKDVEVRIEDNGVRLEPKRWAPFWSSFIHAVRNALDHGIELPGDRTLAGKPERGVIELKTSEDKGKLVVEMMDDGHGVDWEAITQRASRAGLPCATRADLQRALFVDGVSTATSVTDLSGRGIGMGALLHATEALGGQLTVDSEKSRGTRLVMVFPTTRAVPLSLVSGAHP